jgi:AraC-like DNA-binding protein
MHARALAACERPALYFLAEAVLFACAVGGASLRTFERSFLDETGLSLATWRRQSRLLASLALLAEGKSIGEVARAVGYDSAAAFSTAFRQCFGVSPSSYASNGG